MRTNVKDLPEWYASEWAALRDQRAFGMLTSEEFQAAKRQLLEDANREQDELDMRDAGRF